MKFVVDESVERQIVQELRLNDHTVLYIAEESPSVSDDYVLSLSHEQNALLMTSDTDFGELVYRLGRTNVGVILLRLSGLSSMEKVHTVINAINIHGEKLLNSFTVISHRLIRIRNLNSFSIQNGK